MNEQPEKITTPCTNCGKRRRLQLHHTGDHGAESWYCKVCREEQPVDAEAEAETSGGMGAIARMSMDAVARSGGADPDIFDDAVEALSDAAWLGFAEWAIKQPDIRARFRTETGLNLDSLDAKRAPIEVIVDNATGWRDDMLKRFIEWATVEIWGLEYAPAKFREEMESRR